MVAVCDYLAEVRPTSVFCGFPSDTKQDVYFLFIYFLKKYQRIWLKLEKGLVTFWIKVANFVTVWKLKKENVILKSQMSTAVTSV